jgi:hypothetical protein
MREGVGYCRKQAFSLIGGMMSEMAMLVRRDKPA